MRIWRSRYRTAGGVVLGTVGLAIALGVRPGEAGPAVEAYVLFVGALGLAALAERTSRTFPAPAGRRLDDAPRRKPRPAARIGEVARIERELEMATQSAYDSYYRLRPLLRELATTRLARQAVELDAPGSRAEQLLGPEAWQLVRPDLERPADHHAPGPRFAEVERAVAALESLA